MLSPNTIQQIDRLAAELAEMFTPPELMVGCEVMSVADKDEYAADNGWIEAVVGRHNQQRCRWRGQFNVQVGDYVDVLYFASYKLFVVWGQGGDGDIPAGVIAEDVIIPGGIGTPSYDDLQDFLNITRSPGRLTGGVVTPNSPSDGKVDITELEGMIKTSASVTGTIIYFKKAAQTNLTLSGLAGYGDKSVNWLYIDYDGGNLTYKLTTSRATFDGYTLLPIARLWIDGTTVEVLSTGHSLYNKDWRAHDRLITKYGSMDHASGGIVSANGALGLTITDGLWYSANTKINTSSISTFQVWYKSGSATWVESASCSLLSDVFNGAAAKIYESYQNGNNIGTLLANRYGVYWLFLCPSGDLYIVLGTDSYATIGQAQAASVPASLPPYCVNWATLVGRAICQKTAASIYSVETIFTYTFTQSAATDHASLANLQGGIAGEYYHLSAAEYAAQGGVWPLEGDLTNTNDGVSFATVALLIAALAAGEQGIIGNGTFTSDDVDITENIRLLGSGIDATILQTTTDDKVLDFNTGDCLLEGFTLKNTGTSVNSYALYSGSSSLQLTRIKMVLTGAATNNYGAYLSIGTHKLYDCVFNVSGAGTTNTALYVDNNTTVDLFNVSIEAGNVSVNYSANPVVVSFFGGTIVGNIAADGSGATIKLYGPKITGTLTATNSATISGWYYDSNNNLKSASTVDIFPQASTNGLNARFERLFGDDVPNGKSAYQNNPFVDDTLASNIIGFSTGDTAVDSDSYTPSAPFSKSNTGTQYFYVLNHYLRMNSQGSGTCSLTWTSSTGKNDYIAYIQWLTRSVTTYGGEIRFWGVQTPGAADAYWAARFIYDATTYPDWPWRIKIFTGTGVTYAIADGTERAQAPWPVFFTNRLLLRTRVVTGQYDIQLAAVHGVIPDTQVATYLPAGPPFTTFKTATMYLATSYQQIALDSVTVTTY